MARALALVLLLLALPLQAAEPYAWYHYRATNGGVGCQDLAVLQQLHELAATADPKRIDALLTAGQCLPLLPSDGFAIFGQDTATVAGKQVRVGHAAFPANGDLERFEVFMDDVIPFDPQPLNAPKL